MKHQSAPGMAGRSRQLGLRGSKNAATFVLAIASVLIGEVDPAPASTWNRGDVFVAVQNGRYSVFDNDGVFQGAVTDDTGESYTTDCDLNASGSRLYTINGDAYTVIAYDTAHPHGIVGEIPGLLRYSESLVVAANGDVLVANADDNGGPVISRFDSNNQLVQNYAIPLPEFDSIRWIALSSDQRIVFFTTGPFSSTAKSIRRYDLQTSSLLADFATVESGSLRQLRLLPPGDGSGGLLVSGSDAIYRIDGAGSLVQAYTSFSGQSWGSLDLDPDGTTFWAGDSDDDQIYRINIASGAVELGPIATTGDSNGLCVAGDIPGETEGNCQNVADDDGDDLIDCDDLDCSDSPACGSYCARPCGRPASRRSGGPAASDALFTLREAIGITSECYPCECDVDGNGTTTSTDALTILRAVVGVNVVLNCPVCGEVASDLAFERGRTALELQDLFWANRQFSCSVDADPANAAAQLFYALTRIPVYLAADPDLRDLLDEVGQTGSADMFNFTISFPDGVDLPTVARAKPVVLDALAAELEAAIGNLSVAIADRQFQTTITRKMSPGDIFDATFELDAADAAVLSSTYRAQRCSLYFSIGAYSASTFDLAHHDPAATICESSFVGDHPQFLTISSTAAMATAKAECERRVDDLIAAYDSMTAETDPQSDDLLVIDDVEAPDDPRDLRDTLVAVKQSFHQKTSSLPACDDRPFSFEIGKLFDSPITRLDLPDLSYEDPKCVVDTESFPDLMFNGVLPDGLPVHDLGDLLFRDSEDWPLCKDVHLPGYLLF